jgi:hypothetical protein
MRVTAEAVRAAREVSELGTFGVRRALEVAERLFGGDVLMGFGYVDRAALAVFRKDPERQLAREAAAWAEARRRDPAWAAVATMFDDPQTPGDTEVRSP